MAEAYWFLPSKTKLGHPVSAVTSIVTEVYNHSRVVIHDREGVNQHGHDDRASAGRVWVPGIDSTQV